MVCERQENLQHTIKAFIRKGEEYYVAEVFGEKIMIKYNRLPESF